LIRGFTVVRAGSAGIRTADRKELRARSEREREILRSRIFILRIYKECFGKFTNQGIFTWKKFFYFFSGGLNQDH
jgi:hypothetical protein